MSTNRYDIYQYIHNSPDSTFINFSNIHLLYISKAQFTKEWHSTFHSHPYSELFYCVSGTGTFRIKDKTIKIQKNDLILVNPNVEHTECSILSDPLEYIVLGIEGLDFRFDKKQEQGVSFINYIEKRSEIEFYLQGILQEASQKAFGWSTLCKSFLESLLILIFRYYQCSMDLAYEKHTNVECATARRYIDEHFSENITLDILANVAHVNKYYLVHAFSKEYGISPINYLIDKRIQESKYLLETTNLSLSKISNLLGFSSPSYFSQIFSKRVKQSPAEYRRQHQKITLSTHLHITD